VPLVRKTAAYVVATAGLALLLSGCALAGRSLGRYVDDKTLTGSVKMSLGAIHLSHLKRVNVDVYDGTVYLSGLVNTPEDKADAEIAAWRVEGTEQVVNDLVVRDTPGDAVSALPDMRSRHPLLERFDWVARVEARNPGGPALAYDRQGRVVATVYTVSSRVLLNRGVATLLPADGRPVERVSIYPIPVADDVPEPAYTVVLWHVAERAAARH
jgi:BON domain-containing protein